MKNTRKYKDLRNWHWSYQLDIFKALWWWWWWWWRWWRWWWMMMMMMTLTYKISTSSESTGPRSTSASSPGSGESEQLDNKVRSQIRSSESYPNTRQNDVLTSNIFITNSFCFSVGLHPSPTSGHHPSPPHPPANGCSTPYWVADAPLIGLHLHLHHPPIPCWAASHDRMHFWRSHHCH